MKKDIKRLFNKLIFGQSGGGRLGLTTEVRIADTECDNRFLIPRLNCNDFPPKSENYKLYNEESKA